MGQGPGQANVQEAYLDAEKGELKYSAAAHPAMLLLRNGEVIRISENGLMLAAFSFATYTTVSRPLVSGDRILLYSDGILEAADSRDEEFGKERLDALLKAAADFSPSDDCRSHHCLRPAMVLVTER
jgi:sigma-B regulation protein RsbU (phosphoserine phosphatase)